jgi:hypothetical protein
MTDERGKEPPPDARRTALALNRWWRASLLVLAQAGLGSGGVAVFVTQLEAGPVALLATGLVLLLVGASGRLPTRLKVGDSEAAWEAVEGFVSRVANEVPDEQASLLIEALGELARAVPAAAASGLGIVTDRIAYEQMVRNMLSEAVRELNRSEGAKILGGLSLVLEYQTKSGVVFDAAIMSGRGDYVAIEVRRSYAKVPLMAMSYTLRQFIEPVAMSENFRLLFISNQEPVSTVDVEYLNQISRPGIFKYVRVEDAKDLPKVVEAVRAAFQIHA